MKAKRIEIGIKDLKTALDDFVRTGEAVERGEKVKRDTGVYFTSIEAFRKALTPPHFGHASSVSIAVSHLVHRIVPVIINPALPSNEFRSSLIFFCVGRHSGWRLKRMTKNCSMQYLKPFTFSLST